MFSLFMDKTGTPRAFVWMSCKQCGAEMVPVIIVKKNGHESNVLKLGNLHIFRASIKCSECGYVNYFRSQIKKVGDADDCIDNG